MIRHNGMPLFLQEDSDEEDGRRSSRSRGKLNYSIELVRLNLYLK